MQREHVETQLNRILDSATFRRKPRTSSFLRHVVIETIEGRAGKLKEYSIALAVFHRPEDFDPRMDSIVRVEARRLRFTLERYYATEGASDPVVITLRKGSYIPEFLPPSSVTHTYMLGYRANGTEDVLTVFPADSAAAHLKALGGGLGQVFLIRPASERDIHAILQSGVIAISR